MSSQEFLWNVRSLKKITIPIEKLKYLRTMCELLQEVKNFKCKENHYRGLAINMEKSGSTMRTRTLYKGIEVKFNVVEAREFIYTTKLWKALDEEEEVSKWVDPLLNGSDDFESETISVEDRKEILLKFSEAANAMSEMMTKFSKLKQEWEELKGELNYVMDHCIDQVQALVTENAWGRQRRHRFQ